jgi:hypothetical protein
LLKAFSMLLPKIGSSSAFPSAGQMNQPGWPGSSWSPFSLFCWMKAMPRPLCRAQARMRRTRATSPSASCSGGATTPSNMPVWRSTIMTGALLMHGT